MNDRRHDSEFLREFVRRGDQSAFTALVRRHLDLVYATAVRKAGDQGAAEEIAQNVFAALARKAWRLAPDESLPAWLYRTTLLEARSWLRGELRRRRREQTAAELGTTMKTPDEQPALHALVPLLDEALLSLRESDRAALLLRYYEAQSLRDVGAALGVAEDAAQKRVAGALERLSQFFRRRGYKTATVAATIAALQHTAISTPATVATAVVQSAMQVAPPALAGLTLLLSRLASLTKAQTAALCLAVAALPVAWQRHETRAVEIEAATMQVNLDTNRIQEEQLSMEIGRLRTEAARLDAALAEAAQTQARNAAAAGKLEALRARIMGLLTAADYRWPDDLPFIRIPKSALKELNPARAVKDTGKVEDWAMEVLGMTPEERRWTEQALHDYLEALTQLAAARAYETNYLPPDLVSQWGKGQSKTIMVPALGTNTVPLAASMLELLSQTLGQEREKLLIGDAIAQKRSLAVWLGACVELSEEPRMFTVCVNPLPAGGVAYGQFCSSQWGPSGGMGSSENGKVNLYFVPPGISSQFFDPWLLQLGLTNSATAVKP